MTVCIAARIVTNNSAIVLAMDMRGSVEWASAETTYKWIPFKKSGFHALIAGPISTARELARFCGDYVDAAPTLNTQTDIVLALRRGIGKYKREFAEAHVQSRLGITYDEFRTSGKSTLPEDLYRDVAWEIKNHYSNAELIVAGFLPPASLCQEVSEREGRRVVGTPYIFKVSGDSALTCDDFATIGSGGALAEASLLHRSQNLNHSLARTLYQVYEAKRLSERADGVGAKTRLIILYQDSIRYIKEGGLDLLAQDFKRLSPQSVIGTDIPTEYFGVVVAG
jgi:hypothetical protein